MHVVPPDLETALARPEVRLFKADQRSRVWLIEHEGRRWVIKRFEHWRPRQVAAWLIGQHPAQRERRQARRMDRAGLPVAPVAYAALSGGRGHVITADVGRSLKSLAQRGAFRTRREGDMVLNAAADAAAALITRGWFFRDLQLGNLVLGDDGRVCLIDVGSARKTRARRHVLRMLALLGHTVRLEGGSRSDCLRLLRAVQRQTPELGPVRHLLRELPRR